MEFCQLTRKKSLLNQYVPILTLRWGGGVSIIIQWCAKDLGIGYMVSVWWRGSTLFFLFYYMMEALGQDGLMNCGYDQSSRHREVGIAARC